MKAFLDDKNAYGYIAVDEDMIMQYPVLAITRKIHAGAYKTVSRIYDGV